MYIDHHRLTRSACDAFEEELKKIVDGRRRREEGRERMGSATKGLLSDVVWRRKEEREMREYCIHVCGECDSSFSSEFLIG